MMEHIEPEDKLNVIAIPGTTTLELIKLIREGELIVPSSKRVFTMVGTNDLLNEVNAPELEGRYKKLKNMIVDNTRTFSVEHLPPPSFPMNDNNPNFNTVATLMHTGTLVRVDDSAFDQDRISKDGVHLHRHEYRNWLQVLRRLSEN